MMTNRESHISCARDYSIVTDIREALHISSGSGYDFILVPIAHPRYERELVKKDAPKRPGAFTRTDLLLPGADWSSLVVGKISPWIDVDSPCEARRRNAIQAMNQEISFAVHLSLPSILFKLKSSRNMQLAQIINNTLLNSHVQQIWVSVPLVSQYERCDHGLMQEDSLINPSMNLEDKKTTDPWEWWNCIRNLCNSHKKLSPVLEISSKELPEEDVLLRWLGEPLKAVSIPTHIFLTNKKGFPVLSKDVQALVRRFFKLNVQFIISGGVIHKNIMYYYQYLDHLYNTRDVGDSVAQFAKGYEDYLQTPLQPLMENLESQTYEVFEKDPVKYAEYQRAVEQALLDRVPEEKKDEVTTVIMVVGAGRGPLVRASITAARNVDRKVKMYAVEKNQNAIVTLETLNKEEWDDQVTVVSSDMRVYNAPEQADILVSELLGSFSDNELSPECLDGAQKFLKEGGISIPCKYTSYAAPLSSQKLYSEVVLTKEVGKIPEAPFESPYVVRLQNVNILQDPKPVFTFEHPNYDHPIDNERYIQLDFDIKAASMLHGVAGYFDFVLYKDIVLSIHPKTFSHGMFSWFPVYFPIKDPVYCKENSKVTIHFWRKVSRTKVWYEWCLTDPVQTNIHNPGGRSYWIGL